MSSLPQETIDLPAAESSDGAQLASRLADIVLTGGSTIPPNELALAQVALCDLVSLADATTRRRIATRFARVELAPQHVIATLLDDELSVCEPILRDGLCLSNCDLVRIAQQKTEAHRMLIAEREGLGRTVCEALVEKAETSVLERLVNNPTAEFSDRTLECLVRRSTVVPELIMPLLKREQMTPWYAHMMFWWADSLERELIMKRFGIDRRTVSQVLGENFDLNAIAARSSGQLREAARLLRPAHRLSNTDLERLLASLEDAREAALMSMLAEFAEVSEATISWIMSDSLGEPMAVLGKAIGLSRSHFQEMAAGIGRIRQAGGHSENERERAAAIFDTITMDRADAILHLWDRIIQSELAV